MVNKMTDKQIWKAVLGRLEVSLSRANFTTWFKNTDLVSDGKNFTVLVPNGFTKEWLKNKYHKEILEALEKIAGQVEKLDYSIKTQQKEKEKPSFIINEKELEKTEEIKNGSLNPKYTFETFIVGDSNKLAHAACQAIAKKPGEVYNPLFLYGGVGLGKTHLMQAIGNAIIKNLKDKKVVYVTCEKFVNEFIQAISTGRINRFKNNYRNIDVLLIDDIQFLAGKEGTQEEFFHTFNELYQKDKQIVISSDRPPKALHTLEDRLISRFEWGMITDIAPPDIETRMAILKSKCEEKNYQIDVKVLSYIASNIQKNIRELEGALNRLIAYCELNNQEPDLETAENVLETFITSFRKKINTEEIIKEVASFYNLEKEQLLEKRRHKEIVLPRQIAMYLMREEINQPYTKIAEIFGGKDHTTVIHAYEKIKKLIQKNKSLQQEIDLIKQKIYAS